jgi:hypothetical protein
MTAYELYWSLDIGAGKGRGTFDHGSTGVRFS